MQLGNLEFKELEPGSEETPLVLEAPERLDVLRFVQAHAADVARLWEIQPVFVIKNTWQPALLGNPIPPDLSPHFHIDHNSDRNNYLGLVLSNPHEVNSRGPTEYLHGEAVIPILLNHSDALRSFFSGKDRILDPMLLDSLNVLTEADADVHKRAYEAAEILLTLQVDHPYAKEALALEIMKEIRKRPVVSINWSLYPHSAGFVSQRGFHKSGVTVNQKDAQYLQRFYIGKRNGIVQASYRLPAGTEQLHSVPHSL